MRRLKLVVSLVGGTILSLLLTTAVLADGLHGPFPR
jgi:hypothetical protein